MRIGIDARELCGHPTGVGRYLMGLLVAWSDDACARDHEFLLYTPAPIELPFHHPHPRFTTRIVPGPGNTWWEQVRLPAAATRDHLDVFFSAAYSTPLRLHVPAVVALHDLSFVAHPEWFATKEGLRRRWFARESAAKARAVITISDFSKRELLDRFNLPSAKVHVVPPGVTAPAPRAEGLASIPPDRNPHVLYVGSIFNRRHLPDLVQAFAPIARTNPGARLDIVGDNRTHPRQNLERVIHTEGLDGVAVWRSYVPDEELRRLYVGARAFAFLSEYEGLGLTPLEALASGVPAVLLDTPVARESCGDAALYVALNDIKGTTAALNTLLFDTATRASLLGAAPAVLGRYDWSRAGRDTLSVLEASA